MGYLIMKIKKATPYQTIDIDNNMDGKVINGFQINNDGHSSMFMSKENLYNLIKFKEDNFTFTEAMELLLNSGECIRRKSWTKGVHLIMLKEGNKTILNCIPPSKNEPYTWKYSPYTPVNSDYFTDEWEIFEKKGDKNV